MTKRECQRILASLERKGVITRLRPAVQSRGITTFYRFPLLEDGRVRVTPKPPLRKKKGDTTDTLKGDKEGWQEGWQKGDILAPVYKEEQEQEQKNTDALSETSAESFALAPEKQKTNPTKIDPRWVGFIRHLSDYWKEHHRPEFPFPFAQADGKQLKNFLASNPGLREEQFAELIRNRSKSRTNHSDPLHKWLNDSMRYAGGPLDEFGKPIQQLSKPQKPKPYFDDPIKKLREIGAPV